MMALERLLQVNGHEKYINPALCNKLIAEFDQIPLKFSEEGYKFVLKLSFPFPVGVRKIQKCVLYTWVESAVTWSHSSMGYFQEKKDVANTELI